ncbi:MAG: GNAT family N-acetyltransferase [Gammaproteobacteria bacterium]|nr:GNAT family N-acetyltransferase [Gammaproteobacteria bacterium]
MMDIDIRPLERRDVAAVFEAIDESKAEVGRWMDWCREDYSAHDTEAWIEAALEGRGDGSIYQFGIFDPEGRCLGACGLSGIDPHAKYANLGYWVRTQAAGRGIAAEAARRVVDWTFTHTDIERIEIIAAVENRRSQRVAEKIGGVREGVLRSRLCVCGEFQDAVMYSIVRSDRRHAVSSWLDRGRATAGRVAKILELK